MAQVGIHGTREQVSASISMFEPGEYHNGFVALSLTAQQDTVTFFFNDLEQLAQMSYKIAEKLQETYERGKVTV